MYLMIVSLIGCDRHHADRYKDTQAAPISTVSPNHSEEEQLMPQPFDAATLGTLNANKEVRIRTSHRPDRPVVIWIVAVDGAAYVRSVRGGKGQWYVAASADHQATLEVDDRQLSVRITPVTDAGTIEAVSEAYLAKYADSPWAQAMVRDET